MKQGYQNRKNRNNVFNNPERPPTSKRQYASWTGVRNPGAKYRFKELKPRETPAFHR